MIRNGMIFAAMFVTLTAGAQVRTVAELLATASTDTILSQYQSILNTAESLRMHDPLIKQVALRVGFNGNALGDSLFGYIRNEDAYRLQVGFNSLLERNRQKAVKNARVGLLTAEYSIHRQQALGIRIAALASWLYTLPELEACRRLDTLLAREHAVLGEMLRSGMGEVKVSRVLGTEEDINRNSKTIAELQGAIAEARQNVVQLAGVFTEVDKSDLATVEDIRMFLPEIRMSVPAIHPEVVARNARIALESANLDFISSQNRRLVNNLSIGYQYPLFVETPRRFNPQNNISFRIELLAPLPSNNRFKRADALLDLKEAQYEASRSMETTSRLTGTQFTVVENLLGEYDAITDRIENGLIGKMLNNMALHSSISPLDMAELEIAQQKLVVARAEVEAKIGKEYARLIEYTGVTELKYLLRRR